MTSNKDMKPKKEFLPIRMKLRKPFRRQLTHYAEKFLRELFSNISLIKCPTPIGSTKIRPLSSCVISLAQYISTLLFLFTKYVKLLLHLQTISHNTNISL